MANQPQQPDTALHNASHLMQYHDLIESIVIHVVDADATYLMWLDCSALTDDSVAFKIGRAHV